MSHAGAVQGDGAAAGDGESGVRRGGVQVRVDINIPWYGAGAGDGLFEKGRGKPARPLPWLKFASAARFGLAQKS